MRGGGSHEGRKPSWTLIPTRTGSFKGSFKGLGLCDLGFRGAGSLVIGCRDLGYFWEISYLLRLATAREGTRNCEATGLLGFGV